MAQLTENTDFSNVTTLDDLIRYTSSFAEDIRNVVNGNIEFSPKNMYLELATVKFVTANMSFNVPHTLGKAGSGYIVYGANVATSVYNTIPADNKFFYLLASSISTVNLILF